jgi:hypothetical protein
MSGALGNMLAQRQQVLRSDWLQVNQSKYQGMTYNGSIATLPKNSEIIFICRQAP